MWHMPDQQPGLVKQDSLEALFCDETFIPPPEPIFHNTFEDIIEVEENGEHRYKNKMVYVVSSDGKSLQPQLLEGDSCSATQQQNEEVVGTNNEVLEAEPAYCTDPTTDGVTLCESQKETVLIEEVNNNASSNELVIEGGIASEEQYLQALGLSTSSSYVEDVPMIHAEQATVGTVAPKIEGSTPVMVQEAKSHQPQTGNVVSSPNILYLSLPAMSAGVQSLPVPQQSFICDQSKGDTQYVINSTSLAPMYTIANNIKIKNEPLSLFTTTHQQPHAVNIKQQPPVVNLKPNILKSQTFALKQNGIKPNTIYAIKTNGVPSQNSIFTFKANGQLFTNANVVSNLKPLNGIKTEAPVHAVQNGQILGAVKSVPQSNAGKRTSILRDIITSPPKPKIVKVENQTVNGNANAKVFVVQSTTQTVTLPVSSATTISSACIQPSPNSDATHDGPFVKPAPPYITNPVVTLPDNLRGYKVVKFVGNINHVQKPGPLQSGKGKSNVTNGYKAPVKNAKGPSATMTLSELNAAICDSKSSSSESDLSSFEQSSKPVKVIGTSTGEMKLSFTTGNALSSGLSKSAAKQQKSANTAKSMTAKKFVTLKDISKMKPMKVTSQDRQRRLVMQQFMNRFQCSGCEKMFALNRILVRSGNLIIQGKPQLCINCHDIRQRNMEAEKDRVSPLDFDIDDIFDDWDGIDSDTNESEIDVG